MIKVSVNQIKGWLGVGSVYNDPIMRLREMSKGNSDVYSEGVEIHGISIDSRTTVRGNLYVPIEGETHDGHSFAQAAVDNGAVAVIWQKGKPNKPEGVEVIEVEGSTTEALLRLAKQYRRMLKECRVVGITGSSGKTTTKDIVAAVLSQKYKVVKTQKSFNNNIGLPLTILSAPEDTEWLVLEMGMSGFGEIEKLGEIARHNVAMITNIGEAHLLQMGSRENVAKAKMEIRTDLSNSGLFFYNGDEPLLRNNDHRGLPVYSADLKDIETSIEGTHFKLGNIPFFVPIPGKHNAMNAYFAIRFADYIGMSFDEIRAGLLELDKSPMRMDVQRSKSGVLVINDAYNANPLSMRAAIDALSSFMIEGRKVAVLGDMLELGLKERELHELVGKYITKDIDLVYCFGRRAKWIADSAAFKLGEDRVKWFATKASLAEDLNNMLTPEDVVLFKGSRGMRMEEVAHEVLLY